MQNLMRICPDFATNSRKEWRVSLFQSNLRKQKRKIAEISEINFVKNIQYYSSFQIDHNSILFNRVLKCEAEPSRTRRSMLFGRDQAPASSGRGRREGSRQPSLSPRTRAAPRRPAPCQIMPSALTTSLSVCC